MRRFCILWKRWGPYHLARLKAAATYDPASQVIGLQTSTYDSVYQWEQILPPPGLDLRTIFPQRRYDDLRRDEIRKGVCCILDDLRPDAIAIYGYVTPEAYAALDWARSRQRIAVLMTESNRNDAPRRSRAKEWIKGLLVRQYDAAICGGRSSANYLAELGMPRDRVFHGYDVVDNQYFQREAQGVRSKAQEVRAKHGLPENYFLASARFVERKNLPFLLAAYARYRAMAGKSESGKRDPGIWDLVLLGDGPLRDTLNSQLSTLNLRAHVRMPGFRQIAELPCYYALAQAFVHVPLVEQWGLVVNEAMASGLPVLVSNRCGCAPDLVCEGVNGFTFDPLNVEQLARLMLKLSSLNAQLSAYGAASQDIIQQFSPETFARSLHQAGSLGVWRERPFRRLGRAAVQALLCARN